MQAGILASPPIAAALLVSLGLGLAGCGDANTGSPVTAPGAPTSTETRVLAGAAALVQGAAPVAALNVYLNGFHFYNGDMKAQMEAHHYCAALNEEVFQCIIYDGNGRDAKLMGVEYVISRRLFEQLPGDEKKLWHSHVHEVKSGQLIAPAVPERAEHELMEKLVDTYGKTWHTWHTDQALALPLGPPMLMMGFTADGQADKQMVEARDRRLEVSAAAKRAARDPIAAPPVAPGADAWQHGEAVQLSIAPVGPATEARHGR